MRFTNLPGGSVGVEQSTADGFSITLDLTAAGYGWFTDATPWDNAEFLPTSNPNEWIAKADGLAWGKMDLYSVLLHEYGHALGPRDRAFPLSLNRLMVGGDGGVRG